MRKSANIILFHHFSCALTHPQVIMSDRREKDLRAKNRSKKLRHELDSYSYKARQKESPKWTASKNEPVREHSYSWDDISLTTGEVNLDVNSSSEESEEFNQITHFEEDVLEENDSGENNVPNCSGLKELQDAFNYVKIPFSVENRINFSLEVYNKKKFSVNMKPGEELVEFKVEETSLNPPAVLFSLLLKTSTDPVIPKNRGKKNRKNKEDYKIPVLDNSFRQCLVFLKNKKVYLCHCGITRYSLDNILSHFQNINTILNIASSRVKMSENNCDITVNVTSMEDIDLKPKVPITTEGYEPFQNDYNVPFAKIQNLQFCRTEKGASCSFSL